MNSINNNKIDWKVSFPSKMGKIWSYLSQNIGLFQNWKVVHTQTKKDLRPGK
jgi:hypothetical protein